MCSAAVAFVDKDCFADLLGVQHRLVHASSPKSVGSLWDQGRIGQNLPLCRKNQGSKDLAFVSTFPFRALFLPGATQGPPLPHVTLGNLCTSGSLGHVT